MIRRRRSGSYFKDEESTSSLEYVSSGCTLLDLILGGGFPLGRITNIVGDKSTGKTLLAIEAIINFLNKYPDGRAYYHEVEAAFDKEYAKGLGMPVDKVEWVPSDEEDKEQVNTVEFLFQKLDEVIQVTDRPTIYVLDSLDALSDKEELERDIGKGSYNMAKAKKMSELFRRLTGNLKKSKVLFLVISQVRDNIGVMFGKKHTRSGGKALDFYASQVLWLSEVKKIKKTVRKVERVVGLEIKAKCDKNKVGLPYRDCQFPVMLGYGVDDIKASLDWLKDIGELGSLEIDPKQENFIGNDNVENKVALDKHVRGLWTDIEKDFMPKQKKY